MAYNPIEDIKRNKPSVFTRSMIRTAQRQGLSFGEGSPNFELSDLVKEATNLAMENLFTLSDPQTHSRITLIEETAKEKSKLVKKELSTENIYVQSGGTGVLASYMYTHLKRGDEVILFEPFFFWNRTFANA